MLVGDLRAESIDLIVVAGDAHDFRSEHVRAQNLRGLKIGRDEDPGFESLARRVRGDSVGQVASGRTRHGIESESFRLRQSHGDHAVLEAERRQANGVVLDVEILRGGGRPTQLLSQTWSLKQWSEADRQPRFIALGEGKQFGVAPHVRRPLGNARSCESSLGAQRVVVVGNFQRRETVVADGAGLVAPGPSAFPAPQFVVRHGLLAFLFRKLVILSEMLFVSRRTWARRAINFAFFLRCEIAKSRVRRASLLANSWGRASKKRPKKQRPLFPGKGKEAIGKRMQIRRACRIPCSLFPGESWHQASGIYDPRSVAVAS